MLVAVEVVGRINQRRGLAEVGRIWMARVPDQTAFSLTKFVLNSVQLGTELISDDRPTES